MTELERQGKSADPRPVEPKKTLEEPRKTEHTGWSPHAWRKPAKPEEKQ